jgi:hypothetical protein
MFLLQPGPLPDSLAAFLQSIRLGLEPLQVPPAAVRATGDFPVLESLSVDLFDAKIPPAFRPAAGSTAAEPSIPVEKLVVGGTDVSVGDALFDIHLKATGARLVFGATALGEAFLTLHEAREGSVVLEITHDHLQNLALHIARAAAEPHGIDVSSVEVALRPLSNRRVGFTARVTAGKLFLKAVVRLSGDVEIDQELNAVVHHLACDGEGLGGTMACSALDPHLKRYSGEKFSLIAFALGDITLRTVDVAVTDAIKIEATFGSGSPLTET